MPRFLKFWCKLNTRRIFKTCPFRFCMIKMMIPSMFCSPSLLTISYRFSWCFHMYPLVFLQFPWMFPLFPLSVSPVSYFRFCAFVYVCVCVFCFVFVFFLLWELLQGSSWILGDK